ncbi:MAG: RagB/SusD family nutrient uptake outer membrane protein, partial [Chryseobacterium sp.]
YATVLYNGAFSPGTGITVETYVGGGSGIRQNNVLYSPTGYYLRKYINQNSPMHQSPGTAWKRMRFAELYLLLAEAENELNGPTQEFYSALKPIRDRVFMPNVNASLGSIEEARAYVQKEWTTEFALEEQRFWNVRRWKILNKTDKLVTGMEITKTGSNSYTYKRVLVSQRKSWEDRYLIFPLPNIEIAIYGDEWQNPGW